ncbi:hypothetical protein ACFL35_17315 [Candidatus Riflebacteria bacterium]
MYPNQIGEPWQTCRGCSSGPSRPSAGIEAAGIFGTVPKPRVEITKNAQVNMQNIFKGLVKTGKFFLKNDILTYEKDYRPSPINKGTTFACFKDNNIEVITGSSSGDSSKNKSLQKVGITVPLAEKILDGICAYHSKVPKISAFFDHPLVLKENNAFKILSTPGNHFINRAIKNIRITRAAKQSASKGLIGIFLDLFPFQNPVDRINVYGYMLSEFLVPCFEMGHRPGLNINGNRATRDKGSAPVGKSKTTYEKFAGN